MILTCLDFLLETLKYWVGVQLVTSNTSCGEGASLALFGHPSSDACFSLKYQPINLGSFRFYQSVKAIWILLIVKDSSLILI